MCQFRSTRRNYLGRLRYTRFQPLPFSPSTQPFWDAFSGIGCASGRSLGLRLKLLCNCLEVADCPLDGSSTYSLSLAEVPEHCQGQGEFVSEQVAKLLNVVEILR